MAVGLTGGRSAEVVIDGVGADDPLALGAPVARPVGASAGKGCRGPVTAEPRRRPAVHFTASSGWMNDPHAIAHLGGRYHLFYQHNPDDVVWAAGVHWGHASSADLVTWHDHGDVLAPDGEDDGCWSGGIAVHGDTATILYTAVNHPDLDRGTVRLAHPTPDFAAWHKDPVGAVIDGPPPGLDSRAFRDPAPWRDGAAWKVVLGTGIRGVGGAVAQYSSTDLRHWVYDGLALSGTGARRGSEALYTGAVWECPQLFPLDGSWVLLISVWDENSLLDVRYAVGSYNGLAFSPRAWGSFSHAPCAYATTSFTDAEGRRCVMSWLRERPDQEASGWAGALGLPLLLSLDGDRLTATMHPDLNAYRGPATPLGPEPARFDARDGALDLELDHPPATGPVVVRLTDVDGGAALLEVTLRVDGQDLLRITASGAGEALSLPLHSSGGRLRLVLDADIVEVTCSGTDGATALRLPAAPAEIDVSVSGPSGVAATMYRLRFCR